jgi:ABC-2 type transport system permease protein
MIFLRILRLEWRSLTSDYIAWLCLISLAIAVTYAVFYGVRTERSQTDTYEEFTKLENKGVNEFHLRNAETWQKINSGKIRAIDEWSNTQSLTPLFWYWDFQFQKSSVYPASSLAALDLGQSDIYAAGYKPDDPGQFYRETIPSAPQADNPVKTMLGNFDLAFVIVYITPLLIIGMSFNLISAERESGVLGLLLAAPLSLNRLLAAKLVLRAMLVLCGTLIITIIVALLARMNWLEKSILLKLTLWLATMLLYQSFWFAVALFVNSLGKSSVVNAVTLAVCWLGIAILIPACSFLARNVYPVPSPTELREAKRDAIMQVGVDLWSEGVQELDDENSRTSRLVATFLAENPDLKIAETPLPNQKFSWAFLPDVRNSREPWHSRIYPQRFPLVREARSAAIEKLIKPLQDRVDYQHAHQDQMFDWLRISSPALLCQFVLEYVSGTSSAQHDEFMKQVEHNHHEWRRFFVKQTLTGDLIRPDDYNHFPYFHYEGESIGSVLTSIAWPLAAIGILAAIAAGVGLDRFRRYPVLSA